MERYNGHASSLLAVVLVLAASSAATGQDRISGPAALQLRIQDWDALVADGQVSGRATFLQAALQPSPASLRRRRNLRLDVAPLLDALVDVVRSAGVPLMNIHDPAGRRLGVSADFHISELLPAISFQAREGSPKALGAFYPGRKGINTSLVWPIGQFTVRLEGGENSEFGYYAIAGTQWLDPSRQLAIGLGIPMNLRNANGNVGIVVQCRMRLP